MLKDPSPIQELVCKPSEGRRNKYNKQVSNAELLKVLEDNERLLENEEKPEKNVKKYALITPSVRMAFIKKVLSKQATIKDASTEFGIKFSTSKAILQTFRKEGRVGKKKTRERRTQNKVEQTMDQPQQSNGEKSIENQQNERTQKNEMESIKVEHNLEKKQTSTLSPQDKEPALKPLQNQQDEQNNNQTQASKQSPQSILCPYPVPFMGYPPQPYQYPYMMVPQTPSPYMMSPEMYQQYYQSQQQRQMQMPLNCPPRPPVPMTTPLPQQGYYYYQQQPYQQGFVPPQGYPQVHSYQDFSTRKDLD